MKFKNKRHLILTLKKKAGIELSTEEAKELMGLEPKEEDKKPEDKEKPEAAAAAAKSDEKASRDDKKPEDKKEVEQKADAPAPKTMSLEEVGAALAQLQENMNMIMEAVATMMEGQAAPAEEAKTTDEEIVEEKVDESEEEKEVEVSIEDKEDEEEMSDDEMEKELEKTIAELESLG